MTSPGDNQSDPDSPEERLEPVDSDAGAIEFETIPLPPQEPVTGTPSVDSKEPEYKPSGQRETVSPGSPGSPNERNRPPVADRVKTAPVVIPEDLPPLAKRSAILHWVNTHKLATGILSLLFIVFLGLLTAAFVHVSGYRKIAAEFNLAEVQRVEGGSIALDRNGVRLGQVSLQDRRLLKLYEVPDHLLDALIATEDNRFYEHPGYDMVGIARAAVANLKSGSISQGGSTITQQLARHTFNLKGKTLDRKLTEVFIAINIEERYTKDEILESYLNRIYLGSGFWGVGAAAEGYFGKRAEDLTVNESATLAAIIKSPNRISPFNDIAEAEEARNRTLLRMKDLAFVTESQYNELTQEPVTVVKKSKRRNRPHYLLASIRAEALKILGQYRSLDNLTIETSVDQRVQEQAGRAISRQLSAIEAADNYPHQTIKDHRVKESDSGSPDYLQAAIVVMENKNGQIIASVGGREFAESEFDRVRQGLRKPGTAILPFLYAAGFSTPDTSPLEPVLDEPFDNEKVMIGGLKGVLGEWGAESLDNRYEGKIPAAYALAKSKNGATVRFGNRIGLDKFKQVISAAGISAPMKDYPSTYLGESPLNLLEITHAYTVFPNLGWKTKKTGMITRITTEDGEVLYERGHFPEQHAIFDEVTASQINEILAATFQLGSTRRPLTGIEGAVAGKTGTSYQSEDNWFIGYNSQYTWGVWVGFDRARPIYENAFSHDTALPIWSNLLSTLDSKEPLPLPADIATKQVCLLTGKGLRPHCHHTEHGDLGCRLPLPGATSPPNGEKCPLHTTGKPEDAAPQEKRIGQLKPDLFTGFLPVKPKVGAVIGPDPWARMEAQSSPLPESPSTKAKP